jgi:hypothetical protein
MLFKVLQLLFDIALLDCGGINLNLQLFQVNSIHRFNNCFIVLICGFYHWQKNVCTLTGESTLGWTNIDSYKDHFGDLLMYF